MSAQLRIATRRSRLALWQAEHVAALLAARHPALVVSLVPLVTEGQQLDDLAKLQRPLIVGLTINPETLAQIRRTRQKMMGLEEGDTGQYGGDYADLDRIRGELVLARRLFARHNWPELDVSKRSVEETAAAIYQMFQARRQPELKALAEAIPRSEWLAAGS